MLRASLPPRQRPLLKITWAVSKAGWAWAPVQRVRVTWAGLGWAGPGISRSEGPLATPAFVLCEVGWEPLPWELDWGGTEGCLEETAARAVHVRLQFSAQLVLWVYMAASAPSAGGAWPDTWRVPCGAGASCFTCALRPWGQVGPCLPQLSHPTRALP